jgi:hypothetical protein
MNLGLFDPDLRISVKFHPILIFASLMPKLVFKEKLKKILPKGLA